MVSRNEKCRIYSPVNPTRISERTLCAALFPTFTFRTHEQSPTDTQAVPSSQQAEPRLYQQHAKETVEGVRRWSVSISQWHQSHYHLISVHTPEECAADWSLVQPNLTRYCMVRR
jgi:hypothetical protein